MMRFAVGLLLGVVCALSMGRAHAQMAASSLLPSQPIVMDATALSGQSVFLAQPTAGFVPENSAAMLAKGRSALGFGRTTFSSQGTAPGSPLLERDGSYLGASLVREDFAFGIETFSAGDVGTPTLDVRTRATTVGFAVNLGDVVALGVQGSRSAYVWDQVPGPEGTYTHEERAIGATVALGSWFHLGYVTGSDRLKTELTGGGDEDTRRFQGYGLALRTEGDVAFHLEAYRVNREAFVLTTFGGAPTNKDASDVRVAEMAYHGFVLGYRGVSAKDKSNDVAFTSTNVSVGYAPADSVNLVLHRQTGRQENNLGQNIRDSKATAVSLGYRF